MLLHWSDIYRTGHPEIDKQHKQIIEAMNELHEAVMVHRDVTAAETMLKFLDGYVKDHFSYEELCVVEFKCPHAGENKKAHEAFKKLVGEKRDALKTGALNYSELVDFYYEMVYWIKDHILGIDRHNFTCVKAELREKFGGETVV